MTNKEFSEKEPKEEVNRHAMTSSHWAQEAPFSTKPSLAKEVETQISCLETSICSAPEQSEKLLDVSKTIACAEAPRAESNELTDNPLSKSIQDLLGEKKLSIWHRHEALTSLKALVHVLPAEQVDDAISRLSSQDFRSLDSEMNAFGILGTNGLESTHRRELFWDLAHKVGGSHLARMAAELDRGNGRLLAEGIATQENEEKKIQLIVHLAVEKAPTIEIGVASLNFSSNDDCRGVVFSGLAESNSVDRAMKIIGSTENGFRDMIAASLHPTSYPNQDGVVGSPVTYLEADQTGKILEAAARGTNSALKAKAFQAGVEALQRFEAPLNLGNIVVSDEKALDAVREGLSCILQGDTTDIVRELHKIEEYGESLTIYITKLIRDGRMENLTSCAARLLMGNDLGTAPSVFLNRTISRYDHDVFQNSQNAGYFLGCVAAANDAIYTGFDKNINAFQSVVETISGLAPNPVAGAAINSAASYVKDIFTALAGPSDTLSEHVLKMAKPLDLAGDEALDFPCRNTFMAEFKNVRDYNKINKF